MRKEYTLYSLKRVRQKQFKKNINNFTYHMSQENISLSLINVTNIAHNVPYSFLSLFLDLYPNNSILFPKNPSS